MLERIAIKGICLRELNREKTPFFSLFMTQYFKYRISAIYLSAKLYTRYRIPIDISQYSTKVLNIGYWDRIGWGFFISDIGYRGDIRDTRAYQAFISDTIYYEILITKSWFNVIDIIYLIKMI